MTPHSRILPRIPPRIPSCIPPGIPHALVRILALCSALLIASSAAADVILLKDGSRLSGTIANRSLYSDAELPSVEVSIYVESGSGIQATLRRVSLEDVTLLVVGAAAVLASVLVPRGERRAQSTPSGYVDLGRDYSGQNYVVMAAGAAAALGGFWMLTHPLGSGGKSTVGGPGSSGGPDAALSLSWQF